MAFFSGFGLPLEEVKKHEQLKIIFKKKKMDRSNTHVASQKGIYFQNGSPSFLQFVFHNLRHVQRTNWGLGAILVLLLEIGLLGTLEDSESQWSMQVCGCLCLWRVSWECQMRVIDVFWAVSFERHDTTFHGCALEKNACHLLKSESGTTLLGENICKRQCWHGFGVMSQ